MDQVDSDSIESRLEERDRREFAAGRIEEIASSNLRTEYSEHECDYRVFEGR